MVLVKKVVYISYMPLTEKVERDWYISHLCLHGVQVEFWDVTALLFPGIKFQESLKKEFVVSVTNYNDFNSLITLQDIPQTNFVMLLNYEGRFNRLFRILTSNGCRLYFFEWGNFPIKDRSNVAKLGKILLQPKRLASSVLNRIRLISAKCLKLAKPFDVVFAAGTASMTKHPQTERIIAVNLCDYDNYLLAIDTKTLISKPYALFLDINLAFQSDLKMIGWECVDAQLYRASLCRFFKMVEERFGVEVVIAAHPKACYDADYFEGRTILKAVTPELVKDAQMVISHHSTSISYAVLNSKPLLFIYTEEMNRIYADTVVSYINDFAEYLGQPVFNIDALTRSDQLYLTMPDSERYNQYKYNYLTSKESEGRLNRDIVLAELTA